MKPSSKERQSPLLANKVSLGQSIKSAWPLVGAFKLSANKIGELFLVAC